MKKIPTIIGILVLLAGAGVGLFLTQSTTIFRLKATSDTNPHDIRVSNITDSSFTVSWTTDKDTAGFLLWGEAETLGKTQAADTTNLKSIHYITIRNLKPQTEYFYKINAGGIEFDSAGIPWKTKTAAANQVNISTDVASGMVLNSEDAPLESAIVYVTSDSMGTLSAVTSSSGGWVIPLSLAFSTDGLTPIILNSESLLQIFVQGGNLGVTTSQVYLKGANPVPPMTIGQTYDFKELDSTVQSGIPKSSIDVPEIDNELTSKIKLSTISATPTNTTPVTIKSVEEGEIVNTTQPEFFGNGPAGAALTITIHSSEEIIKQVTVPISGTWRFSIPEGLEPGEHTMTISWKDATGILRQLTRSFVVSAAEGPAFESTPSGSIVTPSPRPSTTTTPKPSPTIKATASPTIKPTNTPIPTARLSLPATDSAIPQSGSLTPTLLLSIMGIGLLVLGIFIGFKSKV